MSRTEPTELVTLNVDELDVEELEQRLELQSGGDPCGGCWANSCATYCEPPPGP